MSWTIRFDEKAVKELEQLDKETARRIRDYLRDRVATGDPRRFGKALRHDFAGLWRYRIANYRVICDIQDDILLVLVIKVGHRRNVYS